MIIQFLVTVSVTRIEEQGLFEFHNADGRQMKQYLSEKIKKAVEGSQKNNATVKTCLIKKL